jgi:hypothetical protein
VLELALHPHLAQEALPGARPGLPPLEQGLHRDLAADGLVEAEAHLAHPAGSEHLLDTVTPLEIRHDRGAGVAPDRAGRVDDLRRDRRRAPERVLRGVSEGRARPGIVRRLRGHRRYAGRLGLHGGRF